MRLKLDENIGDRVRSQLVSAGHDVETVVDEQLGGAPDVRILEAAVTERRALVSFDLDFANPFRFEPSATAGLIALRLRSRPSRAVIDEVVGHLLDALRQRDVTSRRWIVDQRGVREYQTE